MVTKPEGIRRSTSPRQLGYHLPAEWELHEATWFSWPSDLETWPHELGEVEATYVEMI